MRDRGPDLRAAAIAAAQLSLITRDQARGAGLSHRQIDHRLAVGRWELVRRGVYGVAGVPPSFERRVMAACLAAGPGAVASHSTAAVLWKLWGVVGTDVELSSHVSQAPKLQGVTVHRVRRLDVHDVTTCGPIPVTTAERTVVDLAGTLHPSLLRKVVDDAEQRRLLTFPSLQHCLESLGSHGRRRLSELRVLLEERLLPDDRTQSPLERQVLAAIRAGGLPEPEVQHQVVVGGRVVVLDLAYPRQRVAIEVDGWAAHRSRSAFDDDRERANLLVLAGWNVLRFTSRSGDGTIAASVQGALFGNRGENTHL